MATTFHFVRYPDGFVAARAHQFPDTTEEPPFSPPTGTTETDGEAWGAVAIHYLKSGQGGVLDQNHRRGGDTLKYVENGWTEIRQAEFDELLPRYMAMQQQKRDAWLREMEDEDDDPETAFGAFDRVAKSLEKAPKEIAIDV